MSLATVIRLEFAYPGVGILAGDSIQYLSIATAHGVIMVFFMIMPAIFGAFGNFLLPTQLGVHDVAFPRLNSAAFWFLPGGLIMLCQLVCVDRRYQRMNSFNIRELQSILQRRFFVDLVNSNDHRTLLDKAVILARFKNNTEDFIRPDTSLFYNYGVLTTPQLKTNVVYNYNYLVATSHIPNLLNTVYLNNFVLFFLNNLYTNIFQNKNSLNYTIQTLPFADHFRLITLKHLSIQNLNPFILLQTTNNTCLNYINTGTSHFITYLALATTGIHNILYPKQNLLLNQHQPTRSIIPNYNFFTENLSTTQATLAPHFMFSEVSTSVRFIKFSNPLINYDYKCGHYLTIWDQLYPQLTTSLIEISRGIRKAPWFYADQYNDVLKKNYNLFFKKFTTKFNLKLAEQDN